MDRSRPVRQGAAAGGFRDLIDTGEEGSHLTDVAEVEYA
jgi:hypothetical protein